MNKISDLCHNIFYKIDEDSDLCHIYTDNHYFMISTSGLDHLRYGLEAHYKQTELLFGFSDEELTILQKKRPRRSSIEEIDYQIDRKSYNGRIIQASDLISRLPFSSQSRNRNGKQNIADKRWRDALKSENPDVLRLVEWYEEEESYIRTKFPNVNWMKGTFAISPCHIYPAKKDRGEDSWVPDRILRDLSLVNKVFDKISSSDLQGKHATNATEAQVAIYYLDEFEWDTLSVSRQALYVLLFRRIVQNFYDEYKITDIDLDI